MDQLNKVLIAWIDSKTDEEKNKPYMTLRSGETFTLAEIATEIKCKSVYGQTFAKKLLNLCLELLTNQVIQL